MENLVCGPYIFDLEVTNLCNTHCAFCPREAITRPKGHMTQETFDLFLGRLKAYAQRIEGQVVHLDLERARVRAGGGEQSPVRALLCGMGECLTHPQTAEWIGRIRSEAGVRASIVTNGALLDEAMMDRLIAARVTVIVVSIPGVSRESYGRYMKLDWDAVMRNVQRAHEMLPGRVEISITIPRDAPFTPEDAIAFWRARGLPISCIIPCHSRGGFMTDERLLSASAAEKPGFLSVGRQRRPRYLEKPGFCGVIARHDFVAWDGRILSCCHDLRGENVVGNVRTDEYAEIARRKAALIDPGPTFSICPRCDDPQRPERSAIVKVASDVFPPRMK